MKLNQFQRCGMPFLFLYVMLVGPLWYAHAESLLSHPTVLLDSEVYKIYPKSSQQWVESALKLIAETSFTGQKGHVSLEKTAQAIPVAIWLTSTQSPHLQNFARDGFQLDRSALTQIVAPWTPELLNYKYVILVLWDRLTWEPERHSILFRRDPKLQLTGSNVAEPVRYPSTALLLSLAGDLLGAIPFLRLNDQDLQKGTTLELVVAVNDSRLQFIGASLESPQRRNYRWRELEGLNEYRQKFQAIFRRDLQVAHRHGLCQHIMLNHPQR